MFLIDKKFRVGKTKKTKNKKIMKKIVLTALVAVSALCANAQVWVGGSLGFNSHKFDGDDKSTTTIEVAPTIGYSLDENWDIALEVAYKSSSYDGKTNDSFHIAPFARYNFAKCGIATFFVDGGFGFGKESVTKETTVMGVKTEVSSNQNAFNIGIRPGVKIELSPKVELDAKMGCFGYHQVSDSYSNFGFNVNSEALSFGLTYKF